MSKLIEEILLFENYKESYKKEDLEVIKASLLKKCNARIKKASSSFLEAIDLINNL